VKPWPDFVPWCCFVSLGSATLPLCRVWSIEYGDIYPFGQDAVAYCPGVAQVLDLRHTEIAIRVQADRKLAARARAVDRSDRSDRLVWLSRATRQIAFWSVNLKTGPMQDVAAKAFQYR